MKKRPRVSTEPLCQPYRDVTRPDKAVGRSRVRGARIETHTHKTIRKNTKALLWDMRRRVLNRP